MMDVFYAVRMHGRDKSMHTQGFKIILVYLNAYIINYRFHGLSINQSVGLLM